MKLRACLQNDIKFDTTDQVAIDEVYLGANWKYVPSFKKFKKVTPPPAFYNLNKKDAQTYYKKQFMEMAARDKMPVLGLVAFI